MELPFQIDLEQLVFWSGVVSLLALLAAFFGVPWVVTRLPSDYFNQVYREAWRDTHSEPLFAMALGLLKNLLGVLLVLLGVVMLFTPGQGLLTLLAGLVLTNFPGKYRLEQWMVSQPGVLRGLNWLRRRHGHPPFEAPRVP